MKIRLTVWGVLLALALPLTAVLAQNVDSVAVKKVNPTGALVRSAVLPGWGQFYNHRYIKGTIIAGGESYLIYGIYTYWKDANRHKTNFEQSSDPVYKASEFTKYSNSRDSRNLRLWIIAATIFYSMFDAYVDAQLSDFNQGDKSFQVFLAPAERDGIQLVMNFKIK